MQLRSLHFFSSSIGCWLTSPVFVWLVLVCSVLSLSLHLSLSAGKTTLINALAHRVDSKTRVTGHIELNGVVASNALLKSLSGYVMQDQLLNGYLTVRETMDYTARLRLPADWTDEQRSKRVSEVIDKMGLTNSQHAIVGVPERKGISGGERKRLCVGMELLTEPKLLFLDGK